MKSIENSSAPAVADFAAGYVLASPAPERVFQPLASKEIVDWWVRPRVFRHTGVVG
jgi:hypothetical protein